LRGARFLAGAACRPAARLVLAWLVLAWLVLAWRGLSQATACLRADRTAAVWNESAIQQPFSECFA
jgi:hypothetical protein